MSKEDNEEENIDNNRIFERYEDRAKTFEKILAILIGFGVFFFFTAFWQYFSIQIEKVNLFSDVQKIKSEIDGVNQQVNNTSQQELKVQENITNVNNDIQKLQNDINHLNSHITNNSTALRQITSDRDAIKNIISGIDILEQNITESQQDLRNFITRIYDKDVLSIKCGNRLQVGELQWTNCNVNEKMNEYFSGYNQITQQYIVTPLQTLSNNSKSVANFSALEHGLDNLHTVFVQKYSENPHFWVTREGKSEFFTDLNDEVIQLWNQSSESILSQQGHLEKELRFIEGSLSSLQSKLTQSSDDLNNKNSTMQEQLRQITKFRNEQGLLSNKLGQLLVDNNTLTDKLTSLQSMERDLTERWKEIQSPFGSVPIELKQLVALFPLSLEVGFLVCSYLITDAIKLRRAIHYSYQTRNTNASVVTDLKIGYIAPLWIDPSNPEKNNLGRFVILSVPLIIFIFSLIMTSYVWYYAPTVFSQLEKLVYSGLYAISIGFFVYGYLLIKKELDYYSNKLPKSSKFVVSEVIEGNLRNLVIDRKVSLEQAESLFEKLSDYRKLFNSGDFSKANERIDELIEETMQIAKMLEVEDRLKTLIVEAKKLRIDYPQDKRKANILG